MSLDLVIDMAWKSALVAGVVLAACALLRHRPPAERVLLLRVGVVLTLSLPLLGLAMPDLRIATPALGNTTELAASVQTAPIPTDVLTRANVPAPPTVETSRPYLGDPAVPDRSSVPAIDRATALTVALAFYHAGAGFLILRLIAGLAALGLWTGQARRVADPAWLAALERAAHGGPRPRLLASARVTSPLSWGLGPGVILINESALTRADRADAVLTHEVGHVRQSDWLFLIVSRLLVALFWFNPLVWLLQRELARQSEHAADAWAVRRIGRADYASALVAMAASARPHAALGMAAPRSELARRVAAILNGSVRKGPPWLTAITAVGCVAFATPLAAIAVGGEARETAIDRPSPVLSPAIAAYAAGVIPRPGVRFETLSTPRADDPAAAARLAAAARQRDMGLTLMEAGARVMEQRATEMRRMAAGFTDAEERASMIEEAADLEREAAELRGDARELAARDPATLRPMTPEEEREMTESLGQMVTIGDNPPFVAQGPVTITADALFYPTPTPAALNVATPVTVSLQMDESGAYRTANGVEVDASGALRTSGGVRMDDSGEVRAPNGARIDPAGQVRAPNGARMDTDGAFRGANAAEARAQMRVGAGQLRAGALEIEAGARQLDELAAASGSRPDKVEKARTGAAELRSQAAALRRQADEMERQADQALAAGG